MKTDSGPSAPTRRLTRRLAARWLLLLLLSVVFTTVWEATGLSAALLLGPLFAGIALGVNGLDISLPRWSYLGAQAVIGAMVSTGITPAIAATYANNWLLFSAVMGATLFAAAGLGWIASRTGLIAGATAIYGMSPGAASAMVLQGEAMGADPRLVAFMQYSRVMLVALAASLVAHGIGAGGTAVHHASWFAPVPWTGLAETAVLAVLAQQAARWLRFPAWAMLGPMVALSVLHASGWLAVVLPRWLLAGTYAVIGWHIGLAFRRDTLRHVWRALPAVAGTVLSLMAFCYVLALCLVQLAGVDLLTAYLATSPGGLDSVALIATAAPRVDLPFVLALQSVRLIFTIALAPLLARRVIRHSPHLRDVADTPRTP